jgi:phytoene synthase
MNRVRTVQTTLRTSYDAAEAIMKERARSFYQAFHRLPEERFRGVAALYAFCRYADDAVDLIGESKKKSTAIQLLRVLEKRLRRLYASEAGLVDDDPCLCPENQLWRYAFEDTVRRFRIPIASFLRQIEGQRMDAQFHDIRTGEELITYCRLVAGSVGTMMLPLLAQDEADTENPEFVAACENLGIGMQITNILRDVGEDLRTRNRLYLPAELLAAHGLKRSELEALALRETDAPVETEIPKSFIALWEQLAQLADGYYLDYEKWLFRFHPGCRIPLIAAALSYRAIADAVRKEGYNCFTKRCYTSAETRAFLYAEAEKRVRDQTGDLIYNSD